MDDEEGLTLEGLSWEGIAWEGQYLGWGDWIRGTTLCSTTKAQIKIFFKEGLSNNLASPQKPLTSQN